MLNRIEDYSYKVKIVKLLVKSIIFTTVTIPVYYNLINNNNDTNDIDYPFSAFSSIAFFCVDTIFSIEIPLMLLSINSFLVWSINHTRTNIINFLDIISIIWVMLIIIMCLNYPIYKHSHSYIDNWLTRLISKLCSKSSENDIYDITNLYFQDTFFLTTIINFMFSILITIVLCSPIKDYVIDFINENLYAIVGSFGLSVVFIIPKYYNDKYFLNGLLMACVGFFIKLLYILSIMDVDISTGLFHLFIAGACQLCNFSIYANFHE